MKRDGTGLGRVETCTFGFYYDTAQFEVSALRLQTVCTTLVQRLERGDVTFSVVCSPFVTSCYPFWTRLNPFGVSFNQFNAVSSKFALRPVRSN